MNSLTRVVLTTALLSPFTLLAGAAPEDLENLEEAAPELGYAETGMAKDAAMADQGQNPIIVDDSAIPVFQFYSSDKAAEFMYEKNEPTFGLDNDRTKLSILFNEERDNALTASFLFDTDIASINGLRLSFGPKIIAGLLSIENNDIFGIGADFEAQYSLPSDKFPLRISAGLTYAPDILTFGQSDRIIDTYYRAILPLTENIEGFVGVRYMQFDTRPGERKLDQQLHFGFRWSK